MRSNVLTTCATMALVAIVWQIATVRDNSAEAAHGWEGKRRISYQDQKDLFYNYYAQPGPFYNQPAKMYVSPLPVPANVGHTWVTYQPFMPHEYLYAHQRGYYTYNQGAGWTRTNVRYGTCGNWCHGLCADWRYPMTMDIMNLNNDFYNRGGGF
jgi:hypothetical protein